jgi:hypothetical protein
MFGEYLRLHVFDENECLSSLGQHARIEIPNPLKLDARVLILRTSICPAGAEFAQPRASDQRERCSGKLHDTNPAALNGRHFVPQGERSPFQGYGITMALEPRALPWAG